MKLTQIMFTKILLITILIINLATLGILYLKFPESVSEGVGVIDKTVKHDKPAKNETKPNNQASPANNLSTPNDNANPEQKTNSPLVTEANQQQNSIQPSPEPKTGLTETPNKSNLLNIHKKSNLVDAKYGPFTADDFQSLLKDRANKNFKNNH